MARTHFKGVVRKRLMPFMLRSDGEAAAAPARAGDDVFVQDGSGGQKAGGCTCGWVGGGVASYAAG